MALLNGYILHQIAIKLLPIELGSGSLSVT